MLELRTIASINSRARLWVNSVSRSSLYFPSLPTCTDSCGGSHKHEPKDRVFVRSSDYSCTTHLSLAIFIAFGRLSCRYRRTRKHDGGCIPRRHAEHKQKGNYLIVWLTDLPSNKLSSYKDWTPNGSETENEVFIRLEENTPGYFADLKNSRKIFGFPKGAIL